MRAVILAAGVARRLAPLTDQTQKCLLDVAGTPILVRMLRALEQVGVTDVAIVVGHCAGLVREAADRAAGRQAIRWVHNPEYARGSALSLYAARDVLLDGPTLVMDADVVFPPLFLTRLLAARHSAVLTDRGFSDTGEEVKIYERLGRVIALGKKVVPNAWSRVGEGVGFFRCDGAEARSDLVHLLERVIADSGGACEYEDALDLLVTRHRVVAVDVTGLPWTEVDFAEDLERAESRVWPAIALLPGP